VDQATLGFGTHGLISVNQRVQGNEPISKETILNSLDFKQGDIYRRRDLIASQRNLYQSNMFRQAVIIVPLLFLGMLVPGLTYGIHQGVIKNDKDLAKLFSDSVAAIAPVIVLAFFAGQFIYCFGHSGVAVMIAEAGGQALARAEMPIPLLLVSFIFMVGVFNLFIGSMSAKYAILAPIFVPMFMMVGISPELTQAAYRIGDSVSNIITPLNPYLIIILVFMHRYVPRGGVGTLIALMVPYTVVFGLVWTALLLAWMGMEWIARRQSGWL
jgi:aminobenzoyl-glutamate transport protein